MTNNKTVKLTIPQSQVLAYFIKHIKKYKRLPTFKKAGLDLERAPSVIYSHYKMLIKKGFKLDEVSISDVNERLRQIFATVQNEVSIGDFTISPGTDPKHVWICTKDGDGGQFSNKLLEPVINDFYNEHF